MCSHFFSKRTGTSTLQYYLHTHGHLIEFNAQKRCSGQEELSDRPLLLNEKLQTSFETVLWEWVTSTLQPSSVVGKSSFVKMMLAANPKLTIPSQSTLRRRILSIFEDYRRRVASIHNKIKSKVSLITDKWVSCVYDGFMVVTAHWIDDSWSLHSVIPKFSWFRTRHTGKAAETFLRDVLNAWSLGDVWNVLLLIMHHT